MKTNDKGQFLGLISSARRGERRKSIDTSEGKKNFFIIVFIFIFSISYLSNFLFIYILSTYAYMCGFYTI